MKKLSLVVFSASILLAAGGFVWARGPSAPAVEPGGEGAAPMVLTISVPRQAPQPGQPRQEFNKAWDAVVAGWEALHPGITIKTIYVGGGGEGYTWLASRKSAKNMPDIVHAYDIPTDTQEAKGESPYMSITEELEKTNPYSKRAWNKDFNGYALLASAKRTMKNYYAVFVYSTQASWYYNKDHFKAIGAREPRTMTEFIEILADLEESGVVPLVVHNAAHLAWPQSFAPPLTAGMFYDMAEKEGYEGRMMEFLFNWLGAEKDLQFYYDGTYSYTHPGMRKAFELQRTFFQYLPMGWLTMTPDKSGQLFYTGEAALFYGLPDFLAVLDELEADGELTVDYGNFPTPQYDRRFLGDLPKPREPLIDAGGVGPMWLISSEWIRENKDPRVFELAVDFLMYLTSPEIEGAFCEGSYLVPTNPDAKVRDSLEAFIVRNASPYPLILMQKPFVDVAPYQTNWQKYILGEIDYDEFAALMDKANSDAAAQRASSLGIELEDK
jgi:ABC-type glycerol-3-phosphate transport system substrate-binding protein